MSPPSTADRAYLDTDGRVRLARSAVAFVDLLGVRSATLSDPEGGLRRLEQATREAYRDYLDPDATIPGAQFSDTLVIASPVLNGVEESALGGLIVDVAYLQLGLVANDWFVRGGIALGDIHLRHGLVYGPGLIEAYDLETRALYPRIILGKTAEASHLNDAIAYYADPEQSPENLLLLRDDDSTVFINYLALLFDAPDDPRPWLHKHRDRIVQHLESDRPNRRVWEKYRWLAEYHNHICREALEDEADLLVPDVRARSQFHAFLEDQSE